MAAENTPDPLAELKDIHLPAPPELWPPAIGWWVLAALALLASIYLIIKLIQHWQKSAYRREAQKELESIFIEHQSNPKVFLVEINLLLKRVALSFYPRDSVAHLSGEAWVSFLDESAATHDFSMGAGVALIDGQYVESPEVDVTELKRVVQTWIRDHKEMRA